MICISYDFQSKRKPGKWLRNQIWFREGYVSSLMMLALNLLYTNHTVKHTHAYTVCPIFSAQIKISAESDEDKQKARPWNKMHYHTFCNSLQQRNQDNAFEEPCAFHSLYLWEGIASRVPSCPSLRTKLSASKSDCRMILPELASI